MRGLATEPPALSNDESARLSILAAHLTERLQIGDDERLTAIFKSLTIGHAVSEPSTIQEAHLRTAVSRRHGEVLRRGGAAV